MVLDPQSFLLSLGLVVNVAGVTFIVHTVLRRSDAVGRTWSIAFVAGMLATLAHVVAALGPDTWWAWPIGNGAFVLSVALLWCGCRQFNGRNPLLGLALGISVAVGVAAALRGPAGGLSAGSAEMFAGIAFVSAIGGAESLRGALARSSTARVLVLVFWGSAVFYLARLLDFFISGGSEVSFAGSGGQLGATAVAIVLVIVSGMSMSVLMTERQLDGGANPSQRSVRAIPGVMAQDSFAQHADDWLTRAQRDREQLVLVILEIANLDNMNTAFGRDYGDQAIYAVGRIAAESAPSAAIVSHLRGSRFAILTTAPTVGDAVAVAEQLHTALVETPVDPVEGIRAIATCGLATTEVTGYDRDVLQECALRALAAARGAGPGSVRMHEAATIPPVG